jgi:hypothetical protein
MTSSMNPGTAEQFVRDRAGVRGARLVVHLARLGVHLVEVVLGQRPGDGVRRVAGDAGGDAVHFRVRQGRLAPRAVGLVQGGGDLGPAHADAPHGAGQAGQGRVALSGRDRVRLAVAGRDVGRRGRPVGRPVRLG